MKKRILKSTFHIASLLAFFCLGAFGGCGMFEMKKDSALASYVDEFRYEVGVSKDKTTGIEVKFETLTDETGEFEILGQCYYYTKVIKINPEAFYSYTERRKSALVYHELTHCACLKGHDNTLRKDKCPSSIMHEYLPSNKCLMKHWESYLVDLVERCE